MFQIEAIFPFLVFKDDFFVRNDFKSVLFLNDKKIAIYAKE